MQVIIEGRRARRPAITVIYQDGAYVPSVYNPRLMRLEDYTGQRVKVLNRRQQEQIDDAMMKVGALGQITLTF